MEETVIIRAFETGLGGDVHVVPGTAEENEGRYESEIFTDEHWAGDIGPNQPFTKRVIDENRNVGDIVLRHIGFTSN
jgi:hypothetical protein